MWEDLIYETSSPYTLSETQNKGTDLSIQAKVLFLALIDSSETKHVLFEKKMYCLNWSSCCFRMLYAA